MEEDDDNFLAGVIEFGDGRQYTVQPTEAPQESPPRDGSSLPPPDTGAHAPNGATDQPVSKEERFGEDFDRRWPRSRPGSGQPSVHPREPRSGAATISPTSTSAQSPQESSRVLFNERSNRLEPYSQRHGGQGPPPNTIRRGSRSDYPISPTEPRRDAPPHTHLQGVQLLQKTSNGAPYMDNAGFSRAPGDRSPISPPDGSRFRDRQPRRDHPSWQANGPPPHEPGRPGPFGPSHASGRPPRDGPFDDRRRTAMGPPPLPGDDHKRQLPPHLSASGSRYPDRDISPRSPRPPPNPVLPSEPPPRSPSLKSVGSPLAPIPPALPGPDVDEVRKAAMHSAAERAKLRRQQEEEEREKEKERARKKAAEIEERIKAMEEKKVREKAEAEKSNSDAQVSFTDHVNPSIPFNVHRYLQLFRKLCPLRLYLTRRRKTPQKLVHNAHTRLWAVFRPLRGLLDHSSAGKHPERPRLRLRTETPGDGKHCPLLLSQFRLPSQCHNFFHRRFFRTRIFMSRKERTSMLSTLPTSGSSSVQSLLRSPPPPLKPLVLLEPWHQTSLRHRRLHAHHRLRRRQTKVLGDVVRPSFAQHRRASQTSLKRRVRKSIQLRPTVRRARMVRLVGDPR